MKYVVSFLILTGVLLTTSTQAAEPITIDIGCSVSTPPFVIRQNDRGIILDTLRAALTLNHIHPNFKYASNADNIIAFNDGKLDALCISTHTLTPSAWLSQYPIVAYQNVAISLTERSLNITSVNDLKGLTVVGFNNARDMLNKEFHALVNDSPFYREMTEPQEHVLALFKGETDVIVMEQTLFRYFLSRLRHSEPNNPLLHLPYSVSHMFPQTVYYAAFSHEPLRDRFDQALGHMLKNGSVETIKRNYATLLSDYLFQ